MAHNQVRPKLLVVDDDEAIADLVQTNLERAGFETYVARSGRAALGFIYNMDLSGVILDIGMPDMDGFHVLSEMAAHELTRKIPILMLSANYQPHDVSRAMELGAKDYLAKPFKEEQLIFRVNRLVRARKQVEVENNVFYL